MIQAICWTLVHSLWQGLLFALIAGVVMLLTRRASAAVRYNVLCGLFFLFLAVCTGTFIYEVVQTGTSMDGGAFIAMADKGSRMALWIDVLGRYCSEHAVLIVWGWLFVFAIKSLQMMRSYLFSQRVRHYGINAAPAEWQERIDMLAAQMGIRRAVRLVESQLVKMPMVIGHLRPMILMPLGLLTGLPEGEIEAVLLHELAHIRRYDYIVNFLQNVAVNIFFFNPGLLWLSSLMREERENCCDDIAIARTDDRAGFIRALISFKEHDLRLARLANAFPGKKNQLIKRAMRIAQSTNKTLDPVEKIFLVISFVLISALVAATSGSSSVSPAQVMQIPGGKYRYFVDTPSRERQAPVFKLAVAEEQTGGSRTVRVHQSVKNEEGLPSETAIYTKLVRDNDETYREVLRKKQALDDAIRAAGANEQAARDNERAHNNEQGVHNNDRSANDNEEAERDKEQALRDRKQAELDAQQAVRDREQAGRDKEQADRDAKQAARDAQQAIRDKEQADRNKEQAVRDKKQAEHDKLAFDQDKKHIPL